jgi:hypothetical protein
MSAIQLLADVGKEDTAIDLLEDVDATEANVDHGSVVNDATNDNAVDGKKSVRGDGMAQLAGPSASAPVLMHKGLAEHHAPTLDELITIASEYVLTHDRKRFDPFFAAAEAWAVETGAVFGGDIGKHLAVDNKMTKDTYVWDLYVDSTWQNAKKLCDKLAQCETKHVNKDTLALHTSIPNREMRITVDARTLFNIFALDRYRGAKLVEVMKPPTVTGFFGASVMIMPKLFNDIDTLQLRYNPAHFKKWPTLRTGGAKQRNINHHVEFAKYIREDPRVVVIGDYAYAERGRLQILIDASDDELKSLVKHALQADDSRAAVSIVSFATCLPDFQLRKRVVYLTENGHQKALMDVFNSPEYELVPFVTHTVYKIGHPLVIARFALIEVWLCQLIEATTGSNLAQRRVELMSIYDRAISEVPRSLQTTDFMGVNVSAAAVKKKIIREQRRVPSYFPTP